MFTDLQV